jgi:replicative DNA helicase
MPASTRILRADNGEDISLGELVLSQERPMVWSVDERQLLVPARLVNAFPSGIKPVFKLRLASGRSVDATANHKFLTVDGWTRLDELHARSSVAVPGRFASGHLRGERGTRADTRGALMTRTIRRVAAATGSDLLWDEVVEIIPLGMQPTFDATVAETHNFIADGVVAHNSLEQDADVVIFLYRDEVYNRDTPDRGTAEVIVAKHRNGPIGVTHLAFLDHYTRFANMARV